jgi:hypothetical protein
MQRKIIAASISDIPRLRNKLALVDANKANCRTNPCTLDSTNFYITRKPGGRDDNAGGMEEHACCLVTFTLFVVNID